MDNDLERARAELLLRRVRGGLATDAEREELVLLGVRPPDTTGLDACGPQTTDDERWLMRHEADERLQNAETTAWTRAERRVGMALLVGGAFAAFAFPFAALASVAGGALLAVSVLRVKLQTLGQDPYEDIER